MNTTNQLSANVSNIPSMSKWVQQWLSAHAFDENQGLTAPCPSRKIARVGVPKAMAMDQM